MIQVLNKKLVRIFVTTYLVHLAISFFSFFVLIILGVGFFGKVVFEYYQLFLSVLFFPIKELACIGINIGKVGLFVIPQLMYSLGVTIVYIIFNKIRH